MFGEAWISPINELATAVVFALWCSKLIRNHVPTFATWCRSSSILSINFYLSPSFPKRHRTRAEDRRLPSLIAGPLQADFVLYFAVGEFTTLFSCSPCSRLVKRCTTAFFHPTPARSGRVRPWRRRLDSPPAGQNFPTPSQPSNSRSVLMIRRYPFGVDFNKEPLAFLNVEPTVQSTLVKYAFQF